MHSASSPLLWFFLVWFGPSSCTLHVSSVCIYTHAFIIIYRTEARVDDPTGENCIFCPTSNSEESNLFQIVYVINVSGFVSSVASTSSTTSPRMKLTVCPLYHAERTMLPDVTLTLLLRNEYHNLNFADVHLSKFISGSFQTRKTWKEKEKEKK